MRTAAALPCLLACALAACGGDDGGGGGGADAGADAPADSAGGFDACEGACRTTALTATFGGATRTLDLAFYGVTTSNAGSTLYVEAYGGAAPGCPTMTSPTPDYTLILGRVPVPADATPSTSPGNLIDFQGDLLPSPAPAAATMVTLTPVAFRAGEFVALDAALTFSGGTLTGHLFATHCASLDSTE